MLRQFYGAGEAIPLAVRLYGATAYGCYQWFCIVAVLGFGRRWLREDNAARRYLTDAVFTYYITHQTAIMVIAHQLKGLGLPAAIEAGIVISGTLLSCVATYEAVRRIALLRPLFGLRKFADPDRPRGSGRIAPRPAEI